MRQRCAFIAALILLVMPVGAAAQTTGFFGPTNPIVPEACRCRDQLAPDGSRIATAPDFGCVLQVLQNVINFAVSFAVVLMVLWIAYIGAMMMFSAYDPKLRTEGRSRLWGVVVGLAVILTAWLFVDFVMKSLYDEARLGPWNSILAANEGTARCIIARESASIISGSLDILRGGGTAPGANPGAGVGTPVTGTAGCPNCVPLSGYVCKASSSCTIDPAVKTRLDALKTSFSGTWIISEAYPPTARHTNACHANGTCVDAVFRPPTTYSPESVAAFANAAQRAGLRPVFEATSCSLRDAARRAGVTAYCSSDRGYGHITGNHFSLYAY